MSRSVYTSAGVCGCSRPGIEKALARAEFEKAAARRPQRNKPTLTRVAKYVAKNAQPLADRIAKVLKQGGRAAALKVSARYAVLTKAEQSEQDDKIDELLELAGAANMTADAVAALRAEIEQAFKDGGEDGLQQVADLKGVDIGEVFSDDITSQVDPEAVFYAANRGGELIKDLAGTTDEDLRGVLSNAIDAGVTPEDLADQIQGLGAFSDARAMTIARTELAFAYVQGNVEGWKASGEVDQKRWILGDLHDIEDECDDCVDAGTIGFDDDFTDGIDFPPAHPNCVCDVLPVLVEQNASGDDNADDSDQEDDS